MDRLFRNPQNPKPPSVSLIANDLLHHDPDLLRQLDAAHRPRVHDDRGRRRRAPPPPARRRDVLPDRDRRARAKVARVAAEQGLEPKEYADQIAEHWRELPRAAERDARLLHPHDGRGPQGVRAGVPPADPRQRRHLRGRLRGPLLRRLRGVQDRGRPRRRPVPRSTAPRPSGSRRRTTSSASRPTRTGCSRSTTRSPTSCCRDRFNEARCFIEGGLEDFSISRAGQPWGVPLPWDASQVTYVWVDALDQLPQRAHVRARGEDLRERFWPAVHHLLGKDILRFHCVFWPAMLLAAGYEPPQQLFVHGYLLLDDQKISKSLGNVIDPLDLIDVYGVDPRALLRAARGPVRAGRQRVARRRARALRARARERPRQPVSRTTAMIARYRDGRIPSARSRARSTAGRAARRRSPSGSTASTSPARSRTSGRSSARSTATSSRRAAVGARQGRGERGRARRGALRPRRRAARARRRAVAPYLPETAPRILAALGQPDDLALDRASRTG